MDGCGAIGIYWHIILPLVRGTLCLLALFTVLACALDFFTHTLDLEMAQRLRLYGANIPVLLSDSAVAALPLFAIFLLVKKLFPQM
jgi:ABC-type glycerol-3-phosphate transport system permease component